MRYVQKYHRNSYVKKVVEEFSKPKEMILEEEKRREFSSGPDCI